MTGFRTSWPRGTPAQRLLAERFDRELAFDIHASSLSSHYVAAVRRGRLLAFMCSTEEGVQVALARGGRARWSVRQMTFAEANRLRHWTSVLPVAEVNVTGGGYGMDRVGVLLREGRRP